MREKKQKNFCITKSNIKIYQNICLHHKNKSLCMDSCPHCKHVPLFFYIFVGIAIYSFGFVRLSAILGLFTLSTNKKNEVIWQKVYSHLHFERLLDLFRYALSSLIMLGSSTSGQQNVTLSLDTHIKMMHLSQKWNCKLYILSTISLNSEVLVTGPSTIMQRGHRIQPRWSAITSVIASTPL
jgi:hypothetical protein